MIYFLSSFEKKALTVIADNSTNIKDAKYPEKSPPISTHCTQ
jgi:hypothetical protein